MYWGPVKDLHTVQFLAHYPIGLFFITQPLLKYKSLCGSMHGMDDLNMLYFNKTWNTIANYVLD